MPQLHTLREIQSFSCEPALDRPRNRGMDTRRADRVGFTLWRPVRRCSHGRPAGNLTPGKQATTKRFLCRARLAGVPQHAAVTVYGPGNLICRTANG